MRPRVLLVDDDAFVLRSLRLILAGDYDVAEATTIEAAAALLASGEPFGAILSDVQLTAVDNGGLRLYELVRDRHPELLARLVFMTGDAHAPNAAVVAAAHGRPLLEKPFDVRVLRARLTALVSHDPE